MNKNIRKIKLIIALEDFKSEIWYSIKLLSLIVILTIITFSILCNTDSYINISIGKTIWHSFICSIPFWMIFVYANVNKIVTNSNKYKEKIIKKKTFDKIYYLLKSSDNIIVLNKLTELVKYMEDFHNPITYGYMEIFIDDIKNKIIAQNKEKIKEHQIKQQLSIIKRY